MKWHWQSALLNIKTVCRYLCRSPQQLEQKRIYTGFYFSYFAIRIFKTLKMSGYNVIPDGIPDCDQHGWHDLVSLHCPTPDLSACVQTATTRTREAAAGTCHTGWMKTAQRGERNEVIELTCNWWAGRFLHGRCGMGWFVRPCPAAVKYGGPPDHVMSGRKLRFLPDVTCLLLLPGWVCTSNCLSRRVECSIFCLDSLFY